MRHATPAQPPRSIDLQPQPDTTSPVGNERWVVGIVAAASFMTVTSGTMVNVALPPIGEHFGVTAAELGWLVTIYLLTFGIAMPFHGRLADRYGDRLIYIGGLTVFTVAALLAGLSVNFLMLLIVRSLQAVGAAAVTSLGMAMVARAVPSERRGQTLGIVTTAVSAGTALGPSLGGALEQFVSWRMVFIVSTLLLFIIPVAARRLPIPEPDPTSRIDWFGGITVGATVAGSLLAVTTFQRDGTVTLLVGIFAIVAVTGLALTVWRQRIVEFPFIERVLLTNRRYLLLTTVGFLSMAGNMGVFIVAPFLYREVNGLSSGLVGVALLPQALVVVFLSRPAGRMADRISPFILIVAGLASALAGVLLMGTVAIGWPAWAFAAVTTLIGVGQALVQAPLLTILTRSIPSAVFSVGIGIYNMLFFAGTSLGAAVSTALLTSREHADSTLLPLYTGPARFSEYSDAFVPGIIAFSLAILVSVIASRTRIPPAQILASDPEPAA